VISGQGCLSLADPSSSTSQAARSFRGSRPADIEAYETTAYARGFPVHERFIRIVAVAPAAIVGDHYDQAMRQLFPSFSADVTMPIRSLAVDPKLLLSR
jgi:hypothetical protein